MLTSALAVSSSSVETPVSEPNTLSLLRLLRMHDDPVCFEAPPMFDRVLALRAFRRFVAELEQRLGQRLDYDTASGANEASFHGEVYLLRGSLRFSNFGRMAAFSFDRREPLPHGDVIASLLRRHGYVLIPSMPLDRRYGGRNPRLALSSTWRTRFFDYA